MSGYGQNSSNEVIEQMHQQGALKQARERIINRINEVVNEINQTNPDGKTKRYLGSALVKKERMSCKKPQGGNCLGSGIDSMYVARLPKQTQQTINHYTPPIAQGESMYDKRYPEGRFVGIEEASRRAPRKQKTKIVIDPDVEAQYYLDSEDDEYKDDAPLLGAAFVTPEQFFGMSGSGKSKKELKAPKKAKRAPSDWNLFVKAVAKHEDLPYMEAIKLASGYKRDGYTIEDFQ